MKAEIRGLVMMAQILVAMRNWIGGSASASAGNNTCEGLESKLLVQESKD
jgi:hypothetical protein